MEILFEFLLEFIFEILIEGGIIVGTDKKVSKWIRYPIIAILMLFYLSVIILIFFVGIVLFKKNVLCSVIIILLGIYFVIASIVKFRSFYRKWREQKDSKPCR